MRWGVWLCVGLAVEWCDVGVCVLGRTHLLCVGCCRLLLVVAGRGCLGFVVVGCCLLSLVVGGCWLWLLFVVVDCGCWLWLLAVVGCCGSLLRLVVCGWLWLVVFDGCWLLVGGCWLLTVDVV